MLYNKYSDKIRALNEVFINIAYEHWEVLDAHKPSLYNKYSDEIRALNEVLINIAYEHREVLDAHKQC